MKGGELWFRILLGKEGSPKSSEGSKPCLESKSFPTLRTSCQTLTTGGSKMEHHGGEVPNELVRVIVVMLVASVVHPFAAGVRKFERALEHGLQCRRWQS